MLRALATLLATLAVTGCATDPEYLDPARIVEVGADGVTFSASDLFTLPIRLETAPEAMKRQALAAQLGTMVPFVRRDDLEISIEWTIRNLDSTADGTARLEILGGNEYFSYDPLAFVIDPLQDPSPPPLMGDIPLTIPAGGELSGVLREDQVAEASLDLDLITRGGVSPFAALLRVDEQRVDFKDPAGVTIPAAAFASMVQFSIGLTADRHMVLEYGLRVRDHRTPHLLHDLLLAAPAAELTPFAPAAFVPPPPPPAP